MEIAGFNPPWRVEDGTRVQRLYPFQEEALERAFSKPEFLFFNHATGCGKSVVAIAGLQEMIMNRNEFDLGLVFTLRSNKRNFTRMINSMSDGLLARNIEGMKSSRKNRYDREDFEVLTLNYEKAHFDFDELSALLKGKRVIFVLDEVQKVLLPNNASKSLKKLINAPRRSAVWPMSASVIENDPLRYWRCFALSKPNPLGTQEDYRKRYVEKTIIRDYGGRKEWIDIWDLDALQDIPDRVAEWTHVVRKNDPEVSKYFKDTQLIVERIQLSDEDRELYNIIRETVHADYNELSHLAKISYYQTLRLMCNTTEGLNETDNKVAAFLRSQGLVFSSRTSAKFEAIVEKIREIASQNDKVIVFSHWTNLSLLPLSRELKRNHIKHVVHHGDMSPTEAQRAQDQFKADPTITVFLSSDAGSHGLSFQEASYVIHVESPHSYDLLMQRSDRIDRIDSYHELLTTYVYVCEDTVEEQIWAINNERRRLSSLIQGTNEGLGRINLPENENKMTDQHLKYLFFGDKGKKT
jgi:SNF2 family DNA or RNA helicase